MSFAMGKFILLLYFSFLESHPYSECISHSRSFFAIRKATLATDVFGKKQMWSIDFILVHITKGVVGNFFQYCKSIPWSLTVMMFD